LSNTVATYEILNRIKAAYELQDRPLASAGKASAVQVEAFVEYVVAAVTTGIFTQLTNFFTEQEISDVAVLDFFKSLTDDTGVAELAAKTVSKAFSDAATVTDQFSKEPIKLFEEGYTFTDDDVVAFGKNPSDPINITDPYLLATVKQLADGFTATDDVDGVATTLDDQEVQFFKNLTNTAGVTDVIAIGVLVSRAFADALSATDSALLHAVKSASDTTSAVEILIRAVSKTLADTSNLVDSEVRAFAKALVDTGSVLEASAKTISKSFSDSVSISEVFAKTAFASKTFADTVGATDDVDGSASILDDQEVQFFKNLTNVAGVSEVAALVVGFVRAFADLASAADSPVLAFEKAAFNSATATESSFRSAGKNINLDAAAAVEVPQFAFDKTLSDGAVIAELLSLTMAFVRSFTDSLLVVDSPVLATAKTFTDAYVASEALALSFEKAANDAAALVDTELRAFGKALTETPFAEDLAAFNFGKPFSDAASLTDSPARSVAKILSDTVNLADALTASKLFTRAIANTVDATDDVDGTASILDDQEIAFVKFNNNTAAATDLFELIAAFARAFTEQLDTNDETVLSVGTARSDTATAVDVFAKSVNFARSFSEQADLTDSDTISVGKELSEAPLAEDLFVRVVAFTRALAEQPAVAEERVIIFSRPLGDSASSSESASLGVGSVQQEQFFVAEDEIFGVGKGFSHTAGVTDLLEIAGAISRALATQADTVDSFSLSFGKPLSNTTSIADAGSLVSQGYCDLSYFADDYVGAVRTF